MAKNATNAETTTNQIEKRRRGRPSTETTALQVRLPDKLIEAIDAKCNSSDIPPSRQDVIKAWLTAKAKEDGLLS